MKMEVLSVQNQFQGQFGVIGSSKVKDWASPLKPPPPPSPTPAVGRGLKQTSPSTLPSPLPHLRQSNKANVAGNDAIDGPAPGRQQYQQYQRQQQKRNMDSVAAASAALEATKKSKSLPSYTYNNNLLYCGERAVADANRAAAADALLQQHNFYSSADENIDAAAVEELSLRLQAELRAAKRRHLACTEVSLPWDLTPRIAAEIIKSSEREPCGVRGCSVYIEFADEPNNSRRIASFKIDPNTVSTFELYLTLKQDKSGWTSLLPQFIKNLTRSNTILISPDFSLTKNKLYSGE